MEAFFARFTKGLVLVMGVLLPVIVVLATIILTVLPFWSELMQRSLSLLLLVPLFFWMLHRPYLVPLPILFAIGVLIDSLYSYPLGLNALLFLLLELGLRFYRNRHSFWFFDFLVFGVVLILYKVLLLLFLSIDNEIDFDWRDLFFSTSLLMICYLLSLPFLVRLLSFCSDFRLGGKG